MQRHSAFTFVGDFDENKLIDLCCYYLGTISGDETTKEKTVSRHVSFPKGKILETVAKDEATNSNIFVGFGKDLEMLETAIECLNSLRENTISSKDLTKLKLYYSNLFDQNKKNNNWWINRINNCLVHYTEVAESVTKNKKIIMDSITAENIQKFLTEYFDEENYTAVILTPEK